MVMGIGVVAFESLRERRDVITISETPATDWRESHGREERVAAITDSPNHDSNTEIRSYTEGNRSEIAGRSGGTEQGLSRGGDTGNSGVRAISGGEGLVAAEALAPPQAHAYAKLQMRTLVALGSGREVLIGPDIPCPTFGKGKLWLFAVRSTLGPGFVTREIDAPSSELRNYARLRDSVEERQLQPRVGLYLEAVHGSGIFVRGGLDYRMYRSHVSALGPQTQTTTLVEVRDPISGNLIRTDTSVTITTSKSTVYNRVQTITTVVGLGYQRTFGRVTPYVLAQAGYELTLKARGTVPDPLGLPVDLGQRDGYLARQPGFQYGGVAGFDVSLSKQWAVGLSVDYFQLGSLRGAEDPIDYRQRVLTPGMSVVYRL